MTAKSFSIGKARRRLSALCNLQFSGTSQSRRASFASQMRDGLIGLRKIFKNNRMIKMLKLIAYILFYIALFFGVIIAINYIEGNGIRSAIN
jgi:hypothetical protein